MLGSVVEADAAEAAGLVAHDLHDRSRLDRDATCLELGTCSVGEVHSLGVERDLRRELPHQLRLVGVRRVSGDDGDASVAHLPSVAVGAQRGIAAPLLGEAGDVGKLVAQARGHEEPPCGVPFAGLEHDLEADGVGVERVAETTVPDSTATSS